MKDTKRKIRARIEELNTEIDKCNEIIDAHSHSDDEWFDWAISDDGRKTIAHRDWLTNEWVKARFMEMSKSKFYKYIRRCHTPHN